MKISFSAIVLVAFCIAISSATTAALTAPAEPQTRIETDQKAGTVRFIVNGHEEARIDVTGLHVRDSIEYGGMITDTGGPQGYEVGASPVGAEKP